MISISVDQEQCIKCYSCIAECPFDLINQDKEGFPQLRKAAIKKCIRCGHCMAVCPSDALDITVSPLAESLVVDQAILPSPESVEHFLLSRRSIRTYKKRVASHSTLESIINVSRYAPSAHNAQPVHWLMVENPEEVIDDWIQSGVHRIIIHYESTEKLGEIIEKIKNRDIGYPLTFGEVKVTEIYHSYRKKTYDEVLEILPLDLPPLEFITKSIWIDIPPSLVLQIKNDLRDFAGGIHAFEHASIALTPLYAMCDRWDIGGTSYPSYPEDGQAKIFIHDSFPGGIGITEQLFSKWELLLANVLQLIKECPCSDGCPSCIQSPKCGNENFPLDKEVAIFLLEELIILSQERQKS